MSKKTEEKIREHIITLSESLDAIVAAKADALGITCDSEFLNNKVIEMIKSWDEPSWL